MRIPSAIQQLQSGKAMVVMERGKTYSVEEGDIIYLCEGLYPLTVIASTARAFTKKSYQSLSEWLPTVVDMNTRVNKGSTPASSPLSAKEGHEARKILGRRLDYRILQYRLEKSDATEDTHHEDHLYSVLISQLNRPETVSEMRTIVANWLRKNGDKIMVCPLNNVSNIHQYKYLIVKNDVELYKSM